MKNLKISLTLLALLIMFGCQTNDALDESPALIEVASGIDAVELDGDGNPVDNDLPESPEPLFGATMQITVEYPRGHDRQAFRDLMTPWFFISGWSDCVTNGDLEVWTIPQYTNQELDDIIQAIKDAYFIYSEPQSVPGTASGGIRHRKGDPFGRNNEYEEIYFYYYNDCL